MRFFLETTRVLRLLPLALALFIGGARAQEPPPEEESAARVERFRAFLSRAPFHRGAFEGLLNALEGPAPLARLIEELELDLAASPADDSLRALLARLYERQGRARAALELLDDARLESAPLGLMRARCLNLIGRPEPALEALEAALSSTHNAELLRELHAQRALVLVELGRDEAAELALEEIARFTPPSPLALAEIAERAEALGLDRAALAHWRAALTLSEGDPAGASRALRGLARLHTTRGELDAAIEAWTRADELTGYGHWMRAEIDARLVELHAEVGSLDRWLTELQAAVEAQPGDRARHAALARALKIAGREADALDVLRAESEHFPRDLALARQLFDALRRSGKFHQARDEARRAIELAGAQAFGPEERELRFALAELFARARRLPAARRELERLLERDPGDVRLVDRATALWYELGVPNEATSWLRLAAELEAQSFERHADLARHAARLGRKEEARTALARAAELARRPPPRYGELAALQLDLGERNAALATLEAGVGADPSALHLWKELASLRERLGLVEGALSAYRELAARSTPGNPRTRAAQELARIAIEHERWAQTRERELALVMRGADASACVVLAELERGLGRLDRAIAALLLGAEHHPTDLDLRHELARAYVAGGDLFKAIWTLESLAEDAPRRRMPLMLEIAKLYAADGRRPEAIEILRQARVEARQDLGTLLEIADLAQRFEETELAREALERANRLVPRDASLRLRLGLLLSFDFEHLLAEEQLTLAYRMGRPEVRERAALELYDILLFDERLESELDRLRIRARRAVPDLDAAELLVALLSLDLEHEEALGVLDRLIERRPREPRFYELRARVASEILRNADALADYERARGLRGEPDPELLLRMVALALRAKDVERALSLARQVGDPQRAARVFIERGHAASARLLLEEGRAKGLLGSDGLWNLAQLYSEQSFDSAETMRAELAKAIPVLEDYELNVGPTRRGLVAIGKLHRRRRDTLGLRDVARRLHARFSELAAVRPWIEEVSLQAYWFELGCDALRESPEDEGRLRMLSREALGDPALAAPLLKLLTDWLQAPIEELRHPARHSATTWRRSLLEVEHALLERQPSLTRLRVALVLFLRDTGETISERDWLHVLTLGELEVPGPLGERMLRAALAERPESALLLAAAAMSWPERAREFRVKLLELLEREDLVEAARLERELALADWRAEIRVRVGSRKAGGLDPEIVDLLARGTFSWPSVTPGERHLVPTRGEVLAALAADHARTGERSAADARLVELERLDLGLAITLSAQLEARAFERARGGLNALCVLGGRSAVSTPDANPYYDPLLRPIWDAFIEGCLRTKSPRHAYQLFRYANGSRWEGTLPYAFEYAPTLHAHKSEFDAAEAAYDAEPTALRRRALTLRAMELAEFAIAVGKPALARDACLRAVERGQETIALREMAARYADRDGDIEAAIEGHAWVAAAKEAGGYEGLPKLVSWPGREIDIARTALDPSTSGKRWMSKRRSRRWKAIEREASRVPTSQPVHNWLALVRLYFEAGRPTEALAALEEVIVCKNLDASKLAVHLPHILQSVEHGEAELDARSLLHRLQPTDFKLLRRYVNQLVEEDRLDLARGVMTGYDREAAGDRKYTRQWLEWIDDELGDARKNGTGG